MRIFLHNAALLRALRFWLISATMVSLIGLFLIEPFVSQIVDGAEEISSRAQHLADLRALASSATNVANPEQPNDLYLAGTEDRVASADMQASLKAIADSVGVAFLGARGLNLKRPLGPRMVAVGVDLEGPASAIRSALRQIEVNRPMMFISALALRPARTSDDNELHAELTVQGAMREPQKQATADEFAPW